MANETASSQGKSNSSQLNNSTNRPSNKSFQTIIPMTIVKTIMKSSPEITTINQDVLYVVCKATELFISNFSKEAFKKADKPQNMDYEKFANLVGDEEKFQFLSEIVPQKVKASEAIKQIEEDSKENQ